jgi:drug/metabolite transporter (DMT)-like permease
MEKGWITCKIRKCFVSLNPCEVYFYMKKMYANLMLVSVTIIWGGGFIATAEALDSVSPFYVMMIRFMGASILPIMISFPKLKRLNRKDIKHGIIAGVFLFFAFAFQTFGLQYSTPSKNAFLTATNVVFVPYLLWLLWKRKPNRKEIIASIVCLFGIALLTLKKEAMMLTYGDWLSLICALFFALHIIALERYSAHIDAIAMTAMQMLTAGSLSTICALCFEAPPASWNASAIGNIAYLIFVSTLLAYLIQTYAQKFTTANTASLILSMEALFASIFSFLILHEVMSVQMIIGAVFIFASILYIEYQPKKTIKKQQI